MYGSIPYFVARILSSVFFMSIIPTLAAAAIQSKIVVFQKGEWQFSDFILINILFNEVMTFRILSFFRYSELEEMIVAQFGIIHCRGEGPHSNDIITCLVFTFSYTSQPCFGLIYTAQAVPRGVNLHHTFYNVCIHHTNRTYTTQ